MQLKSLQDNWHILGQKNPFWAIMTNKTNWNKEDFFQTGEEEVGKIMKHVNKLRIRLTQQRALDFGCGVGRLTQALTKYFKTTIGLDIAPSMIKLAKKYNRYVHKCRYYLYDTDNLKFFPNNYFDFIYSSITLQHIEIALIQNYIKEFIRILSPGGLLVFQLPSRPTNTLKGIIIKIIPERILNIVRGGGFAGLFLAAINKNVPIIEMYSIRRDNLEDFLKKNQGVVVDVLRDQEAGSGWESFQYWVKKGIQVLP